MKTLFFQALTVAVLVFCFSSSRADDQWVRINQGWNDDQRIVWYTTSQGSRLIPLDWAKVLEPPGDTVTLPSGHVRYFLDREHLEKFRYLSWSANELPIGFAVDIQDDSGFSEITRLKWKSKQETDEHGQPKKEPWLGMNCSACHTTEITYNNKRMRIEGGPTLADFQGFIRTLNQALIETYDKTEKWERFAKNVLKEAYNQDKNLLRTEVAKLIAWQRKAEQANDTPLQYGFGRLDAFGHIFNKVALRAQEDNATVPTHRNPADAPVSYPFLWNIHQHDKVQWNGVAQNWRLSPRLDIGALARNVGEVIGVFADLKFDKNIFGETTVSTSAQLGNLVALEKLIEKLAPPNWPAAFPAIDPEKWKWGRDLFGAGPTKGGKPGLNCVSCHELLEPGKILTQKFEAIMSPIGGKKSIGTDVWMACNAHTYQYETGYLENVKPPSKPRLKEVDSVGAMATVTVAKELLGRKRELLLLLNESIPIDDGSFSLEATKVQSSARNASSSVNNDLIEQGIGRTNVATPARPNQTFSAEEFIAKNYPRKLDQVKAGRLKRCLEETSETLAYKARPLYGIWATAPFLHNGSVPTLFDLLLPPDQRPTKFTIGTREFNPEKVGFVTEADTDKTPSPHLTERAKKENTFTFNVNDAEGVIPGNSNAGHDYGNGSLTDEERLALVEYMKQVGGKIVKQTVAGKTVEKVIP